MNCEHKNLAAGRWREMPFLDQMANIGSEVERALNWRAKHNAVYCRKASERALELLDLTLESTETFPRLKELARLREVLVDDFFGSNEFKSTDKLWRNYFSTFTFAARKNR